MSSNSIFSTAATAPIAAKVPHQDTRHGITRTDDYAWLRAENWQEVFKDSSVLDKPIREHLEKENAYQSALMADTEPLQKALFAEMKGRIKEDDSTVPSADGPYAYYHRYREGGQHPVVCRHGRSGGAEQILIDGDELAHGMPYFHLGTTEHSPDHMMLAWSADEAGAEFYTVRVRDLARLGEVLDTSVTLGVNEGGSIQFTNDDPSAAIAQARAEATKDAIAKARTLADAAGIKLGKVLEISEQSFNPQPLRMAKMEVAMDSAGGSVPIAAGENSYNVTVNLSVAIAP